MDGTAHHGATPVTNKNSSCYLTICCINIQLIYHCIIIIVDHTSTDSLLSLKGRINPDPRPLPPEADLITSPLQAQVWQVLLQDHPDRSLVDYVISGIQEGFHIGFNYPSSLCHSAQRNMFSSREHPAVVSQYIASECHMKRMHGPFSSLYNIHTSPIGAIPKKHRVGKWCIIVDLSSPEGSSVNDGIDPSLCSMSYITVQDAIQEITKLGKGALLAKLDIKDAYRMVTVHPTDRHLLGIQWQGATYIDGCYLLVYVQLLRSSTL